MNDKYTPDNNGFFDKYTVYRNDDKGMPIGTDDPVGVTDCFVLRIHDPHARVALLAYAESVMEENPELAHDLAAWLVRYRRDNKIKISEVK